MENFIPNYSEYNNEILIDVYTRIDRERNPLKAAALDNEIKKRFNLPEDDLSPEVLKRLILSFQANSQTIKKGLDKYESMIKQGWIAGIVLGCISFLTWAISLITNTAVNGAIANAYGIIDILLVFGLTFGIYKKSRFCAIALAAYYFIIKIIMVFTAPIGTAIIAIIWLVVLTTFFIRAIIGTFQYHEAQKNIFTPFGETV